MLWRTLSECFLCGCIVSWAIRFDWRRSLYNYDRFVFTAGLACYLWSTTSLVLWSIRRLSRNWVIASRLSNWHLIHRICLLLATFLAWLHSDIIQVTLSKLMSACDLLLLCQSLFFPCVFWAHLINNIIDCLRIRFFWETLHRCQRSLF